VRTIDASTEEGKKALETLEAIAAKPKKGWNRMGVELGIVAPFVPSPESIELLVDAKLLRKGRGGVLTPTEMGVRALETSSFDLNPDMDFDENDIYICIEVKGIDEKTGIEKLNITEAEGWNQIYDIPMRYDYNVDNVRTYSSEWLSDTIWTQLHLPKVKVDSDSDADSDSDSEKFSFGSDWMHDLTGKEPPDPEVHALPVFVQLKVNPPAARMTRMTNRRTTSTSTDPANTSTCTSTASTQIRPWTPSSACPPSAASLGASRTAGRCPTTAPTSTGRAGIEAERIDISRW